MKRLSVLVALLVGCESSRVFDEGPPCAHDGHCQEGGVCEPIGYCSLPDAECASGKRYAAGPIAGECVGLDEASEGEGSGDATTQ